MEPLAAEKVLNRNLAARVRLLPPGANLGLPTLKYSPMVRTESDTKSAHLTPERGCIRYVRNYRD